MMIDGSTKLMLHESSDHRPERFGIEIVIDHELIPIHEATLRGDETRCDLGAAQVEGHGHLGYREGCRHVENDRAPGITPDSSPLGAPWSFRAVRRA